MGSYIETLVYILEIIKYLLVSYYVIGLKTSYKKRRFLLVPIVIILGIVVYISGSYILAIDFILGCSVVFLWFDDRKRLSVFCTVIEFIAISFVDLLVWLLIIGITPLGENYQKNEIIVYLIGNIVGVLPWILLGMYIKIKKVSIRNTLKNIRLRNYLFILLILIALMITTACLQGIVIGDLKIELQRLVVIVTVFFGVFVVVLGVLYIYVADSRNKLAKINSLDKECLEYQKNYYTSVMKKDEELRAFKHDVNKHLDSLKVLYDEGRTDELGDYLKRLTGTVEQDYIYKTGNIIADYIVNGVVKEILEKADAAVSIVGKFPTEIKMDNTEMCIVLANILNNAKEAILEYDGNKMLEVIIKNYKERIYITVKNSSNKRNTKENKTTKKDKENHGYGLKNVRRVVDKYDGTLEMKWEEGIYTTEIMM